MHQHHNPCDPSWIRTKTPPLLGKMELGWKSGTMTSKLLLPQWIFHPFICMPLISGLPEKSRAAAAHLSPRPPSEGIVVQSLSHVCLFETPRTAAHQASLSVTISQSVLKLMSIESMMPSNHIILCCPLLLLTFIFPSIRVFSNELAFRFRWPKYWRAYSCLNKSSLYFLNLLACLWILSRWGKNLKFTGNKKKQATNNCIKWHQIQELWRENKPGEDKIELVGLF